MVKNSKYLILTLLMVAVNFAFGQIGKDTFSPIKRDSEITRITLENYFKKYSDDQLLNRVVNTETQYESGEGLKVNIDARNARIMLDNGITWHAKESAKMMDTFFDEDMISLQQERLITCLLTFLRDFNSYLPKISSNEAYTFDFEVKDQEVKKGEKPSATERSKLRSYKMSISIQQKDLASLTEKADINTLRDKITIAKSKL